MDETNLLSLIKLWLDYSSVSPKNLPTKQPLGSYVQKNMSYFYCATCLSKSLEDNITVEVHVTMGVFTSRKVGEKLL
jgi:hypothetical protein